MKDLTLDHTKKVADAISENILPHMRHDTPYSNECVNDLLKALAKLDLIVINREYYSEEPQ